MSHPAPPPEGSGRASWPAPGTQLPPPEWPSSTADDTGSADTGSSPPGGPLPPPAQPRPPEPDEPSGRGVLVAAVAVLVVLVAAVGVFLLATSTDTADDGGGERASAATTTEEPSTTDGSTTVYSPDEVAALQDVFDLVDEAELTMIMFITDAAAVVEDSDASLDDVAPIGRAAAQALVGVRGELEQAGTSDGPDAAIRAAYLEHLGDWIDYTSAVADDPTVYGTDVDGFGAAITESAGGFVRSIEVELGNLSGLPDALADTIDTIIERGFSSESDQSELGEI